MSTNLINNYTSSIKQQATAAYSAAPNNKQQAYLDQQNFNTLKNRQKIGPINPKGHLLNSSIFNAPSIMAKDFAYDIKALKQGLKGDSNDHQLGKINDIGMKLGGLGIASFLFTQKATALTKGMEFVGFASFFASMAIWPKIALQLPARLIHGFDIQKQYVDSQGRKKPVFQDPQYIPWDLYSNKEINKIGDRLHVPKNMQNRREYIQDKMKKIALQNNTMWMLTAGFATPIMSALICNQVEPYLNKALNNVKNENADKLLTKLGNYATADSKKMADKNILSAKQKALNEFFKKHENGAINEQSIEELAATIANESDALLFNPLQRDFAKKFIPDKGAIRITDELVDKIVTNIQTVAKTFRHPSINGRFLKIVPTTEDIQKLLENQPRNQVIDSSVMKDLAPDFLKMMDDKAVKIGYDPESCETFGRLLCEEGLEKTLEEAPVYFFNQENKTEIEKIANTLFAHSKKVEMLDAYTYTKVANAPETVLANKWNEASNSLIKTFGISSKEIAQTRYDRELVQELMDKKFQEIAKDKNRYEATIKELATKVKEFDSIVTKEQEASFKNLVDNVYNTTAKELSSDMQYTIYNLVSNEITEEGSKKRIHKEFLNDRMLGVKYAYYRLIETLDLYRRIATGNLEHPMKNEAGKLSMKLEVKEEIVDVAKQTMIAGHSSDHAIKLFNFRNPTPEENYGDLKIENGDLKYQIHKPGEGVEISYDKNFYEDTMKFMFTNELDGSTKAAFKEQKSTNELNANAKKAAEDSGLSNVLEKIKQHRTDFFNKIGYAENPVKPGMEIISKDITEEGIKNEIRQATPREKFILVGLAPDEMFSKIINQSFNSKKWLKMFGKFGLILTGVTVASQFFFGRLRKPEGVKESK